MNRPSTLVLDIGGTSTKAAALDHRGHPLADRIRVPARYPLPPGELVEHLAAAAADLPPTDRVSIGFPGMVRSGRVLTAPEFVAVAGLGSAVSTDLLRAWSGFALQDAVSARLARPTLVANDADLLGLGVVEGRGLELVVTLGAGFGTALLLDGALCPHLELAHHVFRHGETYNDQLGDAARRCIGADRWTRRVQLALEALHSLLTFDRVWAIGGNTRWLTADLGSSATVADDRGALVGGVRLWSCGSAPSAGGRTGRSGWEAPAPAADPVLRAGAVADGR